MEIHKRDCGRCDNFHFTWDRYWCSAGEKYVIPTAKSDSISHSIEMNKCFKYVRGYGHNHEF